MLTLFCCCCCCWCPTVTFKICTDGVDLIIQLSLFNYYYSIITIKLSTPIGLRCWCCCETRSASPTSWRSTGTPLPSALYHQHHGHRHNVHHGHHGHHHHDQELFHQQQGHSIHRHCYNSYVSQLLYTAVQKVFFRHQQFFRFSWVASLQTRHLTSLESRLVSSI